MSLANRIIAGDTVNNDLYKAIFSGDTEKVSTIIDTYGLSHCPRWAEGQDLVLTAVECKNSDIAKLLVKKGCNISYGEGENVPHLLKETLSLAVNKGDCELISLILDMYDAQLKEKLINSLNLLHVAVSSKQKSVIELLLAKGANVNWRTDKGDLTPLHIASVSGNVEIVESLLDAGCDLESKDCKGNTSLALAVSVGNTHVVKTLAQRGADCSCRNKCGLSPLIDATSNSYIQIVEDLLHFEADVNVKNSLGLTALHIACLLKNRQLISLLLDGGADINATDNFGSVPCDIIFKKLSPGTMFFENPSLSYFLARHIAILKSGGFLLNKKNEALFDRFCSMYCNDITVNDSVLSPSSHVMASTMKSCEREIAKMNIIKNSSGSTVFDVFKKMKNPLSLLSENEILFLKSIDLKDEFPTFESIMRNSINHFKLRNKLISLGQEWFMFLQQIREDDIVFLPEEMRILIISFLTNDEIKQLVKCGEEIQKQNNWKTSTET